MAHPLRHLAWLVLLLAAACAPRAPAHDATAVDDDPPVPDEAEEPAAPGAPHVFLRDPARLLEHKLKFQKDREHPSPVIARVLRDAERALTQKPFSVTEKPMLPPSGDRHDYLSLSPYHWPDPKRKDGLPYVFRDGELNPEHDTIPDHDQLGKMCQLTDVLGLAYYFTDNEAYATQSALLLRTFFVNAATRMNPHLKYSQIARGHPPGRQAGVIDAACMPELMDGIEFLESSPSLTPSDRAALKAWLKSYLTWLRTSKMGLEEDGADNNHANWYDAQVVAIALATGQRQLARSVLKAVRPRRIKTQIERDGRLPGELRRTRAWHYSIYSITALEELAWLGDHASVPLWTYHTKDGRSIRQALAYLVPFAQGKRWAAQQITPFAASDLWRTLFEAGVRLGDASFTRIAASLEHKEDDLALLYAPP